MPETVKVNLSKTLTSLRIISVVAGVIIACGVAIAAFDSRMDKMEAFRDVMEERSYNMGKKIDLIYDIVKDLSPKCGKSTKPNKELVGQKRDG